MAHHGGRKRLTLFNDNSPTIGWATKLASKRSTVAEHLVQAIARRAKQQKACPFTPIHIAGKRMAIADIPSQSFGSNPAWHCKSDDELLTLFNSTFPLPSQQSWTVFHLDCRTVMHVISALRMKPFVLDDWRRLPSPGKLVGEIGQPTSHLRDLIRTHNTTLEPHRICPARSHRMLWTRTTGTGCNSYRRNHCRWADDILGHRT